MLRSRSPRPRERPETCWSREHLRAARLLRQTGNRARRAESGAAHGAAPAVPTSRSEGFPRRRAVRGSSRVLAESRGSDKVVLERQPEAKLHRASLGLNMLQVLRRIVFLGA